MGCQIAVDIGGTFTDCMVVDEHGARHASKALTTHGSLAEGVLDTLAVNAEGQGRSRADLLAATEVFVHGSTVATNAVLTRQGSPTGLITTRGHEDAIIIGKVYSKRAGLPEREIVHSSRLAKPEPIVPRELIRGVDERIDVAGEELAPLDEAGAAAAIDQLLEAGVEAIAVSLLWSFVNPAHERRLMELIAERAPDVFATASCELAPVLGEYERTAAVALNAYVGPKVVGYLGDLEQRLRAEGLGHPLTLMQASGGLTSVEDVARRPITMLDSGPTGGILGCEAIGRRYERPNVICTDVGGTSFDVGVILEGRVGLDPEPVISQYTTRLPKVGVASIGAGGGSIAWIDEAGLLRVGPQSAGSRPGPACYGLGGEAATVTDANLMLGYLSAESFLGGRMQLRPDLAEQALAKLGEPIGYAPDEVAVGIWRIINAHMADLIQRSTIELGHDPRECILISYGGAGPTHAVHYGQDIGAQAILVPPNSTVFSAEGMLGSPLTHSEQISRNWQTPLDEEDSAAIETSFAEMERRIVAQFEREGVDLDAVSFSRRIGLRYRSQVHTLEIDVPDGVFDRAAAERLLSDFEGRYAELYGRGAVVPGMTVESELLRVTGSVPPRVEVLRSEDLVGEDPAAARVGERLTYVESQGFAPTPVYDGERMRAGHLVAGPAIIERMGDSIHVPEGFEARLDGQRMTWLRPLAAASAGTRATADQEAGVR